MLGIKRTVQCVTLPVLSGPVPPSSDPFYTVPPNFHSVPEDILRLRLYSILLQPFNGIPASSSDISEALGNGWYVNVPDHEDLLASFRAGVQSGHATLDSIRALLSSNLHPGHNRDTKHTMWGYSGDSLANAITDTTLGGLISNLTNIFNNITASPYAGLIPSALLGITTQFAEAHEYLLRGLEDPIIKKVVYSQGYQGHNGVLQMPIFMYKAIHNELSAIKDTNTLVERYCGIGVEIWYHRNEVGRHITEITIGRGSS
ncbi:hypothetical protein K469DRAFT_735214 [Zopfia rhizophila CBS 207.26]|uniref:Uncharacterized protein n=1 Tax=Zopfia rhizophila CBS 207.26 TaxID=1314779 RepID=A0A6A6EQK9_9PEZI|nr:hypothetical protein K469DRAFT_735214 [Zopfia rhizophila CBS 207.26]